jgi:arylsulfatase A-like enzyme
MFWRYGPSLAIRRGDWKLVKQRTPDFQLFNLAADVGETNDLAAQQPQRKKEMQAELEALNQEMMPPLWA